jgi:hypothetical protein
LMVTARWTIVSPSALLKSQFQLFSLAPINPDHRVVIDLSRAADGEARQKRSTRVKRNRRMRFGGCFRLRNIRTGYRARPTGFVIRQKMATKA